MQVRLGELIDHAMTPTLNRTDFVKSAQRLPRSARSGRTSEVDGRQEGANSMSSSTSKTSPSYTCVAEYRPGRTPVP
jgi:hypothetical protein